MANSVSFVFPFGFQPSEETMARVNRLVVDATVDYGVSVVHNMNTTVPPKVSIIPLTTGSALPAVQFTNANTITLSVDPTSGGGTYRLYIERLVPVSA